VDAGVAVLQQYGNGAELLVETVKLQLVEICSMGIDDLIEVPAFISPGIENDIQASGFDGAKESFDVLSVDDDVVNKTILSRRNLFFRWGVCHASCPPGATG
jgi:hypothetical protein